MSAQRHLSRRRGTIAALPSMLSAAGLAGCRDAPEEASAGATAAASSQASATDPSSASSGSTEPGEQIPEQAAMYKVGGHKLYMSCASTGSPTVVYVHGWVNDSGHTPHESASGIRDLLAEDYRVCLYDRRNVGSSDTVDAVQSPADMRRDMEQVLQQGGAKPPYILMAASFGGLVAYDSSTTTPIRSRAWSSSTRCSPTSWLWTGTHPTTQRSVTSSTTTCAARSSGSASTS